MNRTRKRPADTRNTSIAVTLICIVVICILTIINISVSFLDARNKAPVLPADTTPARDSLDADPQIVDLVELREIPTTTEAPAPVYELTREERGLIEEVVAAEARGEPYEGQVAVAQCILNACLKDGIRPPEAIRRYGYAKPCSDLTPSVVRAVSAVFDKGETVTDEPILYFYAPALCTSSFHESQIFVMEIGGHRFFKEA